MRKLSRYFFFAVILYLFVLAFVKFGWPRLLRSYIEMGIGNCRKNPILCIFPREKIINPGIEQSYLDTLTPYRFPDLEIYAPKGFAVVHEMIKKVYYKNQPRKDNGAIIYVLHEDPDFFLNLFPQMRKAGVHNDYEFMARTMQAKVEEIKNIPDAFFVVMKSIFIPGLGSPDSVKMAYLITAQRKGFVNFNLSRSGNYFDCNIFDDKGNFFKVYIKDKAATLDLDKALAIALTVKMNP